ncbi:MAG TPA: peptidoglycan bridge formation glycyltransferase FemA/FemB family protein [Candidatus Binatia bacterium]|jgi:lipid II:glycine glycyltransferase (peptidoglycan interpeptide bridge formation enzyme)|nr:peptidoglycan bridge formation glycyltransferase FemA/FemB family protein [Candidatus Binatia bacterium]
MLTHVTRNEEEWDAFVLRHGGGFLQSWGWSQFQEALGRKAYRFRVDGPGETEGHPDTIAQFLLIYHTLPLGRRYAYLPRGPVVALDDGPVAARGFVQTCAGALRETVRREGAVFARVEWPWEAGTEPLAVEDIAALGFRPVKAVQPADTVIMELTKSEEELLAGMHHKTRYNARLAEKHGVTVREGRHDNAQALREDIDLFWSMLSETATRDKFHTHEKAYYATMIDVLSAKKSAGLRVRLVFAEHEGKPIAAALVGEFGATATYLHGASLASHRQLMAPNLLHWTIMKEAKKRGLAAYDLWGVAPTDDAEHPWAGITRFKTGFGGKRVSYLGAWELPGDPLWYTVYRYAKRFRNV